MKMPSLVVTLDRYLSVKAEVGQLTFTQAELVKVLALEPASASTLIQEFLRVQSSSKGEYLKNRVYRVPDTRTSNAVWTFGDRSKDVLRVVSQAAGDFKTRSDVLAQFLASVQGSNPRAAKTVAKAVALLSVAVQMLEDAV